MAQDVIVTCMEAEGSDPLREFLLQHQNALKLSNTIKLNNIYNKLNENDIDYDELLKFEDEQLLCQILVQECKISKLAVTRIITVLKNIPQSQICKQKHNVKIITISNDEQNALNNIQKASKEIQNILNNITVNMSELDKNSKECEIAINYNFDNIIKTINKRRGELISNLKTIKQKKENKLLLDQNKFNEHKKSLNNCYKKCQLMIHDLNINKSERKTKILTNTNKLLENEIINNFSINRNNKMHFKIDINKINNILLNIGEIENKNNISLSPIVNIQNINDTSVIISIHSNIKSLKCANIEYKLEYSEINDDIKSNDDIKLEYKSIIIKYNKNIKYEIKLLKPFTNYIIHAAIRNKYGWSKYCKNIVFKTKQLIKKINDILDNKYIGKYHTLNANIITHTGDDYKESSSFFTKIVTNGHHHWRIKIKYENGYGFILFGIWKTKSGNLPTDKWFTLNHNGYAYIINGQHTASQTQFGEGHSEYGVLCEVNDIIEMHLNMNELTLKYSVNNKDQGIAYDVENTQYKAAIFTCWENDSIEFVKYTQD